MAPCVVPGFIVCAGTVSHDLDNAVDRFMIRTGPLPVIVGCSATWGSKDGSTETKRKVYDHAGIFAWRHYGGSATLVSRRPTSIRASRTMQRINST